MNFKEKIQQLNIKEISQILSDLFNKNYFSFIENIEKNFHIKFNDIQKQHLKILLETDYNILKISYAYLIKRWYSERSFLYLILKKIENFLSYYNEIEKSIIKNKEKQELKSYIILAIIAIISWLILSYLFYFYIGKFFI